MDDMIFVRRCGRVLVFACALTGRLYQFDVGGAR
jgi:hypothetical protein